MIDTAELLVADEVEEKPAGKLGRGFWALWAASTVSGLGDGLSLVALPLLAVRITSDPRLIAGVAVAQGLSWLLLGLPAGAMADRWDRGRTMIVVDIIRMAIVGLLAAAVITSTVSLPLLYCMSFVLGGLESLFGAAAMAAIPAVVEERNLDRANGYIFSAQTATAQLAGPAFGGLLFAMFAAAPFIADASSFLLSAALLVVAMPRRRPVSASEVQSKPFSLRVIAADVAEGLRSFVGHPLLRTLSVLLGGFAMCQGMVMAVLVLFGTRVLGLSEGGYGLFLGVGAVGNVVGGVISDRVTRRFGVARVVTVAAIAAAVAYAATGFTSSPLFATGCFVIEAVAIGVASVATLTLRQKAVADELRGRVANAFRTVLFGAMPVGALIGGFLASWLGLRAPLVIAGTAQFLLAVVTASRLKRLVALSRRPIDVTSS